jgi:hypothetical protein
MAGGVALLSAVSFAAGAEPSKPEGQRSFEEEVELIVELGGPNGVSRAERRLIFPKFRAPAFAHLSRTEILLEGKMHSYPVAASATAAGAGDPAVQLRLLPVLFVNGPGLRRELSFPRSFSCHLNRDHHDSERCAISNVSSPILVRSDLSPSHSPSYTGRGEFALEVGLRAQIAGRISNARLAELSAGPIRFRGKLRVVYHYDTGQGAN